MIVLSGKIKLLSLLIAIILHLCSLQILKGIKVNTQKQERRPIKVKIVKKQDLPKPTKKKIVEATKKKKIIPKKKKKKKQFKSQKISKTDSKEKTTKKAIQGMKKSYLKSNSSVKKSIKVPVGNTLLESDKGIRKKTVAPLKKNLASPARLLYFKKPNYTDDALDAGLEGKFIIDVFIDEKGFVLEAEMRKKVGYGMDSVLVKSALKAKFVPRRNKLGNSISGWHFIKITLVLP